MSEIDIELNRAQFMRGPGSLLFNTLGHIILPQLYATEVPSQALKDIKDPGKQAGLFAHQFLAHAINNIRGLLYDLPDNRVLDDRLQSHTYNGTLPHILREAIQSNTYFPINILRLAESIRPKSIKQPVYETFSDFTAVLRSDWFYQDVCLPAAITRNGFWGNFSTLYLNDLSEHLSVNIIPELFAYTTNENGLCSVGLSKSLQSNLITKLRDVNQDARTNQREPNTNTGFSSGCPVAHMPKYPPTNTHHDMYDQVVRLVGQEMVDRTIQSGKTAIQIGLVGLADMLDRSYAASTSLGIQ